MLDNVRANIYLKENETEKEEGRVCRDAKVNINRDMIKSSHRAKTIKLPSIGNGVESEGNSPLLTVNQQT